MHGEGADSWASGRNESNAARITEKQETFPAASARRVGREAEKNKLRIAEDEEQLTYRPATCPLTLTSKTSEDCAVRVRVTVNTKAHH